MRAFLAVEIPKKIREIVVKIQKNFEMKGIKLVEPENLHWTLKFFGEISEEDVKIIEERIKEFRFSPFEIELKGLDAFPSKTYPKIIWIGVGSGKEEFIKFLSSINELLKDIGKKEDKEPIPHLTIARVKFFTDKERVIKLIEKFSEEIFGKMTVNKMSLYKSTLTPKSPIYEALKEFPLVKE